MERNYVNRCPFSPTPGEEYDNAGGGRYRCDRLSHGLFDAWMINVKSGWAFLAHGIGRYPDGKIDWNYSTKGHFEEGHQPTRETMLRSEEKIMEAVCELCHWPYAYRADGLDEDVLIAEKCEVCKAALIVKETLEEVLPCEA